MGKTYLEFFKELCRIPHGSGNTKAISDYCVSFAKARGLAVRQDALGNVVIRKAAAPGRELEDGVILQGHLDMVAVKEPDLDFDFTKDPLRLKTDGDYLYAEGTSLGADDGIAVAMALAVLDSNEISHPPLECLFTVDEEIGMLGAVDLDMSDFTGRYMLNMDSDEEGYAVVSCAGGCRAEVCVPFVREAKKSQGLRIELTGLTGGHSGTEIHKGRANANCLLADILKDLPGEFFLSDFRGGAADNAIAPSAVAVLAVNADFQADEFLNQKKAQLQAEWRQSDPNLTLAWETLPESELLVMKKEDGERLLQLMTKLPNGPLKYSVEIPDMVELSTNLGIVHVEEDGAHLVMAPRSARNEDREELKKEIQSIAQNYGAVVSFQGEYPGWPLKANSKLQRLASQVYREQTGKELILQGIHAGLECGIFSEKLPNLDIISFGAELLDIHSTKERLSLSSAERTWKFLLGILEKIS
ncbi:aminoacyl-histidine dipeptidase [Hominifimenecus sp. rT4P-3]|uniref:aminoacyl-histidine dipeptidase n=1 Tax=Hominifimenecus sp. rT4P-3 TaxID=3242979 RepID=UPI003DA60346